MPFDTYTRDMDGNDLRIASRSVITLTHAQVIALRATPRVLVPAPGANHLLQFLGAVLIFDRTAAYAAGATDDLAVKYTDGAGAAVSGSIEATGFLTAAEDAITFGQPLATAPVLLAASVNAPLVLHNTGGAEFTAGDAANLLRVVTHYRVINLGL